MHRDGNVLKKSIGKRIWEDQLLKYKFVKIELKGGFRGSTPKEDYYGIVEPHAAEGWRLVEIFTPPRGGAAVFFELVSERPKQE
jgi:hypothetical protein